MALVNYSSSSESDDENIKTGALVESKKNNLGDIAITTKRSTLPQASSLLGKRKGTNIFADIVIDDPSLHEGRIRSFKHERGNWASFVYIPISLQLLEDVQQLCCKNLSSIAEFKSHTDLHISLSKTVILQYHFIESFVKSLQTKLENLPRFRFTFTDLNVYTNQEKTRTFLAVKLDKLYETKMLDIVHNVDLVMQEFRLEKFYENPSFHISILWCLGNKVCEIQRMLPEVMLNFKEIFPIELKVNIIKFKSGFKEFNFTLI